MICKSTERRTAARCTALLEQNDEWAIQRGPLYEEIFPSFVGPLWPPGPSPYPVRLITPSAGPARSALPR
jgi:hypothetical protein